MPAAQQAAAQRARGPAASKPPSAVSLASRGLPVGANISNGRISRAPPSLTVAASCLMFGVLGIHANANGDPVTQAFSVGQMVLSFIADVVCNSSLLSAQVTRVMCACDRGVATAFSLWLVALSVATVSAWMVLALAPLPVVLAWSRASTDRSVWIVRHSIWHAFVVFESLCVQEACYRMCERDVRQQVPLMQLAAMPFAGGLITVVSGLVPWATWGREPHQDKKD